MTTPRSRPCEEVTIRSVRAASDCTASAKRWVLVVTVLASMIANIDESIVNVALPAIETDLVASAIVIQWLVNAYTLCLSAFLLLGGAAGDRYGRRKLFVVGVVIFATASVWCGISPDVSQLITARAIQGAGAALLIPSSLAIIGATFDENERGKAIGTWASFSALAAAAGPLLGGWIVDHYSWRWIFLINPLLVVPTIWIAVYRVPESRNPEAKSEIDWKGAILVLLGLGTLAFALIASPIFGWTSLIVIASLTAGVALIFAFILVEAHSRSPMLPLALFQSRMFSAVNLLTLLLYGALGGAFFFVPFVLIQVQGYPATLAGTAFLPLTIIMAGLSRWAGGLLDRFGAKLPLTIGPVIAAVGFALMALTIGHGYWLFLVPIVIIGFGMVITVAPLTTTVINAVPAHQVGIASGINNAVASIANLLAIAMLGAIAIGILNQNLDRNLQRQDLSSDTRHAIQATRGKFVIEPQLLNLSDVERQTAETIIKDSLASGIRFVVWLAAILALAGAVAGTVLPRTIEQRPKDIKAGVS